MRVVAKTREEGKSPLPERAMKPSEGGGLDRFLLPWDRKSRREGKEGREDLMLLLLVIVVNGALTLYASGTLGRRGAWSARGGPLAMVSEMEGKSVRARTGLQGCERECS